MNKKYIFITGGVISGLGKGITSASLGRLLKNRGFKISMQKLDPYLNVDAGTMNPIQHGECFVTDDGAETDLDLGHYERFTDENLTKDCNVTTGQIYKAVIEKERKGEYLGNTVQVIPHITNEIKNKVYEASKNNDAEIMITEIGGTVGDIESQPFLEAIRQIGYEVGKENVCYIHVALIPYLQVSQELKTKTVQHSVKLLREIGIQPNIIVTRSEKPIDDNIRNKLALFCNIPSKNIIQNLNCDILYEVPLLLHNENLDNLVCEELNLGCKDIDNSEWIHMINTIKNLKNSVTIGLIGKYTELHDAYISVVEALKHGGYSNNCDVNIKWINSEKLTKNNIYDYLNDVDGIIVPGGFGDRGIEGMILAEQYGRERNIPTFGICLGMQTMTIEYARNVCNLNDANSTEFDKNTKNPVIDIMEEQKYINKIGGTMRLGNYNCRIFNEKLFNIYNSKIDVSERHRHRFEFNNSYKKTLKDKGLIIAGINEEYNLVEIITLADKSFYVGVQFHPELKSRPNKPHPLFKSFIANAKICKKNKEGEKQ